MTLADLLNQATPGPWEMDAYDEGLDVRAPEHAVARVAGVMTMGEDADPGVKARALGDAALIALAPDMARLLIDMAARLKDHKCRRVGSYALQVEEVSRDTYRGVSNAKQLPVSACPTCALLARFADLDAKAGGTE